MSVIDTAEYRRLALIAAGVDPSQIPPVIDTATWRRLMIGALAQIGDAVGDASALTTGTLADARLSSNVPLKDAANTFTQNQTLDGTNNVAPNQTAASGASIMTRDLVRDESFFLVGSNFYPRTFAYGNSGVASTAAVHNGDFRIASAQTGTATSGFGRITLSRGVNNVPAYSGGGIGFESSILGVAIRFALNQDSASGPLDSRVRLIFGANGATPATADNDPLNVRGFGAEMRAITGGHEFRIFAHNGTTFAGGSWIAVNDMFLGEPLYLSVISDGAGTITGYFGRLGSRPLTASSITGGPTSNGNSANSYVDLVAVNSSTGTPGVSTAVGLSEVQLFYRPA